MKSNLLLVFKCCKDNNCSFLFDATKFSIQDVHSGRVLYKGLNEASFYPIYGDPFQSKSLSLPVISKSSFHSSFQSANTAVKASSSTWHSRLGHPHSKVLQTVLQTLPSTIVDSSSSSHSFCKHCVLGKMSQLPFPISCTHATKPLQLVHSDV
jgi:hypothetical protein